jgi:hypothetical protein
MTTSAATLNPVPRFKKRMWIPFAAAAILSLGLSIFVFHPCKCWRGTVLKKAFILVLVSLGLLIVRHVVAAVRKDEGFPWIFYVILTLAVPFIMIAFIEIAVGGHSE